MEKKAGYVYALKDPPDSWTVWARALDEPLLHWVADGARLVMGAGIPAEWKEQGAMFGPRGELRWWSEGGERHALLLMDQSVEGLSAMEGEWIIESHSVDLQDLGEPRVKPNFECYPHGSEKGRMEIRIYYRDSVPVFISPRRLQEPGKGDSHA
ncbi:hypothetical protein [Thermoflexus hugenholtzii]